MKKTKILIKSMIFIIVLFIVSGCEITDSTREKAKKLAIANSIVNADKIPPELVSVSVSPEILDLEKSDILTVTVKVKEDTNLDSSAVCLNKYNIGLVYGLVKTEDPTIYKVTIRVPSFYQDGIDSMSMISLRDTAGNHAYYYGGSGDTTYKKYPDISTDVPIPTFQIINKNEDTIPPSVDGIDVTETSISGSGSVTIMFHLSDDNSGTMWPSGILTHKISGDTKKVVFDFCYQADPYITGDTIYFDASKMPVGEWILTDITLYDLATNQLILKYDQNISETHYAVNGVASNLEIVRITLTE